MRSKYHTTKNQAAFERSKREPLIIDVQPEELIREEPRASQIPVRVKRSRRTSAVRELEALARAGQRIAGALETPEFWLGVAAKLLERR